MIFCVFLMHAFCYCLRIAHTFATDINTPLFFTVFIGRKLTLAGDGRCDSPGYSAKYGTSTLMDVETDLIVDFHVSQSTDTTSSVAMEKHGFEIIMDRCGDRSLIESIVCNHYCLLLHMPFQPYVLLESLFATEPYQNEYASQHPLSLLLVLYLYIYPPAQYHCYRQITGNKESHAGSPSSASPVRHIALCQECREEDSDRLQEERAKYSLGMGSFPH